MGRIFSNKYFLSSFALLMLIASLYVIYLDFKITAAFEGKIWSLPSHVYARPLELFVDKPLSASQLEHELKLTGYRQVEQIPTRPGEYRQWKNQHFELITRPFQFWDGEQKSQALRIDLAGEKIYGIYELYTRKEMPLVRLEPARIAGIYPAKAQDRQLLKLEEVPEYLVLALLAVEDRRFYQHWGIDPRSIGRALLANISAGGTVQGGSTLTQQLVKNLFLSSERKLSRKLNEAIMALLLEMHYDKALILETYLNEVYLGQDGANAIHGFALASHYYFDKPLQKLSKDQIALLVGLVKGASWYDPRRNPERALQRRNQVLASMLEQNVINAAQLARYQQKPLGIAPKSYSSGNRYPAFIDLVKRQLRKDYDDEDLQSSGLRIFTTLDPVAQRAAEKSVIKVIPQLERYSASADALQTAVIVASAENGEVQALIGDRNPRFPGFNRSLDAVRQVGSLIKPAIYLAALQQPGKYHLASKLDDSPLHLKASDGKVWSPQNYDKKFTGDILLYQALLQSRNIPTVRLGLDVGLADIVRTLKNLGVVKDVPPYPSMTLGAFNLSPLDVAEMYQTLAAKGFHSPLRAIRAVLGPEGRPLNRYPLQLEQSINPDAVYLLNSVLHQVTQAGTASALKNNLNTAVAGKTGTTDDLRDSWFAGFSEDRVTVVWVGRDDNQNTGLTGSTGALKVWTDLMNRLPLENIQLTPPEGVRKHWIDSETGGISEKGCAGTVELAFLPNTVSLPRAECKSRNILDALKDLFD
ncbi:MAG: penicillin-binding protein 1B [Gammaproteobacteria bacterium]|nr:penicillin-binding protein 1B [Gammaproteobacteria bacterium]